MNSEQRDRHAQVKRQRDQNQSSQRHWGKLRTEKYWFWIQIGKRQIHASPLQSLGVKRSVALLQKNKQTCQLCQALQCGSCAAFSHLLEAVLGNASFSVRTSGRYWVPGTTHLAGLCPHLCRAYSFHLERLWWVTCFKGLLCSLSILLTSCSQVSVLHGLYT